MVVERLQLAELGRLDASLQRAVGPHRQLVLEDQLQELDMVEVVAGGLVQTHLQAFQQPGQTQLLQGGTQGLSHRAASFWKVSWTSCW
jgi:hypothetical protein